MPYLSIPGKALVSLSDFEQASVEVVKSFDALVASTTEFGLQLQSG